MSHATDNPFRFLVIGAGRGGTSLLAGLLDGHPRLEMGFEMGGPRRLMGRTRLKIRNPFWRWDRNLIERRCRSFTELCRDLAAEHPDKIWGNKITTEQLAGLADHNLANPDRPVDFVDYFFAEALAGVKVIFILRDGRTCVRSKMQRTGQPLELACERWRFSVEVYRYLTTRHPACVALKFEDLLTDPEGQLRPVCELLDVPFDETMIAGTRSKKMLPEYRKDKLDPSKTRLDDVPAGCMERIEADLRDCGYLS